METKLFERNYHWDGGKSLYRNWTFSRHLFQHMLEVAPWFRPKLELATDAFIVPWRSRNWAELKRNPSWPVIRRQSRAIFGRMVDDHAPDLIFTSGKQTLDLLWSFLGVPALKPVDLRVSPSNRNYTVEWYRVEPPDSIRAENKVLDVVRLPHFSRGGYAEFAAIGEWVGKRLPPQSPEAQLRVSVSVPA